MDLKTSTPKSKRRNLPIPKLVKAICYFIESINWSSSYQSTSSMKVLSMSFGLCNDSDISGNTRNKTFQQLEITDRESEFKFFLPYFQRNFRLILDD